MSDTLDTEGDREMSVPLSHSGATHTYHASPIYQNESGTYKPLLPLFSPVVLGNDSIETLIGADIANVHREEVVRTRRMRNLIEGLVRREVFNLYSSKLAKMKRERRSLRYVP